MYVETWQEIERQNETAENVLRIESTPTTRKIIIAVVAGEERVRHSEELREFNEVFETSGPVEWRMYTRAELPEHVVATLEGV